VKLCSKDCCHEISSHVYPLNHSYRSKESDVHLTQLANHQSQLSQRVSMLAPIQQQAYQHASTSSYTRSHQPQTSQSFVSEQSAINRQPQHFQQSHFSDNVPIKAIKPRIFSHNTNCSHLNPSRFVPSNGQVPFSTISHSTPTMNAQPVLPKPQLFHSHHVYMES
jgi:hypothetical protein